MKRTRIKAVNPKRRKRLYERNFGEKAEWIRSLHCVSCGRPDLVQAAHARARGMGGCGGSSADLIPLCATCHAMEHQVGKRAFEEMNAINLDDEAEEVEEMWQRRLRRMDGKA